MHEFRKFLRTVAEKLAHLKNILKAAEMKNMTEKNIDSISMSIYL